MDKAVLELSKSQEYSKAIIGAVIGLTVKALAEKFFDLIIEDYRSKTGVIALFTNFFSDE